jgi:hypothetical protein
MVSFWESYRSIFIVFLVFVVSVATLTLLFLTGADQSNFLYGISLFIIIIGIQPSIYFIILLIYYFKYLVQEGRYESEFKKAVVNSQDYVSFMDTFYTGQYSDKVPVKVYLFENDIKPVKDFVESSKLELSIAIYKLSKMPHDFVLLSDNEDIIRFVEIQEGCVELNKNEKIRWIIKYGVEIPCIYGNKKLKKLIDLP